MGGGGGGDGHNTRRERREKRKGGKEIEKDIQSPEISKCGGGGREGERKRKYFRRAEQRYPEQTPRCN